MLILLCNKYQQKTQNPIYTIWNFSVIILWKRTTISLLYNQLPENNSYIVVFLDTISTFLDYVNKEIPEFRGTLKKLTIQFSSIT